MANPKLYGVAINLSQNEIQNFVIQNLSAAPSSPKNGQAYYDTTLQQLLVYNQNASAWQLFATNSAQLAGQLPAYYLNRANHTGTQTSATISDLTTTVQAYRLDQFAAPTNPVSMGNQRIANVAAPLTATDAANKGYVDAAIQGVSQKPTAQAATTGPLPTNTYSNGTGGVGATLTGTSNGALAAIDGYTPLLGDWILVLNETAAANRGLYKVTQLGSGSAPYILTRDVDMDQPSEFPGGLIAVANGTNTGKLFLCVNNSSMTVGTTAVSFTSLINPTVYTQGNGINIAGLVISAVPVPGGNITNSASGLDVDTTKVVRKYATAIGDGSTTSFTVTHNLGTQDINVDIYQSASPYSEIEADVAHSTANTATIAFTQAPTSGQYRVVIHG